MLIKPAYSLILHALQDQKVVCKIGNAYKTCIFFDLARPAGSKKCARSEMLIKPAYSLILHALQDQKKMCTIGNAYKTCTFFDLAGPAGSKKGCARSEMLIKMHIL